MRYARTRNRFRYDGDPEEFTLRCSRAEIDLLADALEDKPLDGARELRVIELGGELREFVADTEES